MRVYQSRPKKRRGHLGIRKAQALPARAHPHHFSLEAKFFLLLSWTQRRIFRPEVLRGELAKSFRGNYQGLQLSPDCPPSWHAAPKAQLQVRQNAMQLLDLCHKTLELRQHQQC